MSFEWVPVWSRSCRRAAEFDALRAQAASCTACPLYREATQTVFGAGAPDAELILVGEVPGDREDLDGHPFVGPAARRCRIPPLGDRQRRIVRHRAAIDAALDSGLSNALIESTNTKIRLITRVAFGFHSAEALTTLAMLSLGGNPPVLPRRK